MFVEIAKKYVQNEDYFYLELNIRYDDQDDERLQSLVGRNFNDIADVFRKNFENHSEIYKIIDERFLEEKYAPEDNYFYQGSRGFREFTKDLTERELRKLTEILTDIILERATYVQKMFREEQTARVSTSLNPETESITLEKINIKEPALMIANNQCYAMELKPLKDVNSIEGITESVYNTIYSDLHSQIDTIKKNYQSKIDKLKTKYEKQQNELFVEGLKNASEVLSEWEFADHEGNLYLKYKREIVVDRVAWNGHQYEYGDQFKKMYVQGLKVKVKPSIGDSDVIVTRGYNLHFRGTSGFIGSLNGMALMDILRELPRSLEIANMDSPLNSDVSDYLSTKFLSQFRENAEEDQPQEVRRVRDWIL